MPLRDSFSSALCECLCQRCQRGNCKLPLASCSDGLEILDCDRYKQRYAYTQPLCDYILFLPRRGLCLAAIEMKEGSIDLSQVVSQIRNAAAIASRIVAKRSVAAFLPLLVHKGGFHRNEYKLLLSPASRIPFRGKKYRLLDERCGTALAAILQKYA